MPAPLQPSATRSCTRTDVILFLLLFLFAPYAAHAFRNANSVSRMGLAHALATRGELTIDAVADHTIDKARHGDHYYCDKAPGMSLLCVPAVAVADWASDRLGYSKELYSSRTGRPMARYLLCAYACLLSSSAWIYALSIVLFRRALIAADLAERSATLITLFAAFGTPPLLWSTTLFGHCAASSFLFSAFALYWLARKQTEQRARWPWLVGGLCLGLAVLVELTALPAAALIACFLIGTERRSTQLRSARQRAVLLALGGVGPALVLLSYNALAFQHPLKLGYASVQGFEGMQTGFFGISPPRAETAFALLFGEYRGLFWIAPILLVACVGCLITLRDGRPARGAAGLALVIAAYYLALNAGYYYWHGGNSTGPRHMTPIALFLMFGLGLFWRRAAAPWLRGLVWVTGALSMVISTTCALVRVTAPADGAPLLRDHILHRLLQGRGAAALPQRVGLSFSITYAIAIASIAACSYALLRSRRIGPG